MKHHTRWHAAELLSKHLKGDARKWYGYLRKNIRHSDQQHGYKITAHAVNGQLTYTQAALFEFIRVMKTPHGGVCNYSQATDTTTP